MSRPTAIVYFRPWWQQRAWRIAGAAAAGSAIVSLWLAAQPAAEREPIVVLDRPAASAAPRLAPAATRARISDAPDAPVASPGPLAGRRVAPSSLPAPLSTMVAPGVHVTPLSVPPDTLPTPAGPSSHDSEPEN